MASKDFGTPLISGILLGILGYVLGILLSEMDIFPALAWENIGLFVGFLFGLFKDRIL